MYNSKSSRNPGIIDKKSKMHYLMYLMCLKMGKQEMNIQPLQTLLLQ